MIRQIAIADDHIPIDPYNETKSNSSMRANKSRLPSFTSFLGSADNNSNQSNTNKEEKIGFRKFAKSLLFSGSKTVCGSTNIKNGGNDLEIGKCTELDDISVSLVAKDGFGDGSIKYYETTKQFNTIASNKSERKLLGDWRSTRNHNHYNNSQLLPSKQAAQSTIKDREFAEKEDNLLTKLLEANLRVTAAAAAEQGDAEFYNQRPCESKESDYESSRASESRDSKFKYPNNKSVKETNNNNRALKQNENIVNQISSLASGSKELKEITNSRVVMLSNIPMVTSLTSILCQVNGGPLEKIRLFNNMDKKEIVDYDFGTTIDWNETGIQLFFYRDEDASQFMKYASTGMFIINGHHISTRLVPKNEYYGSNKTDDGNEEVDNGEDDDNEDRYLLEMMGTKENARRVLVFKKPVAAKSKANKHFSAEKKRPNYPDPILNYSDDFSLDEIKSDFNQFGPIVEISPVVSRKLCFAVQYFDVRSAMIAKHKVQGGCSKESENDSQGNEMSLKYKGWYVWYGKDPTDKGASIT